MTPEERVEARRLCEADLARECCSTVVRLVEIVPKLLDEIERMENEYQAWIVELEGPTPRESLERIATLDSQLAAERAGR